MDVGIIAGVAVLLALIYSLFVGGLVATR